MPQFINRQNAQINPQYLQILQQQAQAKLAQDEILRQDKVKNLATTIDGYGGLEAAAKLNPNLVGSYLTSTGMDVNQAKEYIKRVHEGTMSAEQSLLAAQGQAFKTQTLPEGVQTPTGQTQTQGVTDTNPIASDVVGRVGMVEYAPDPAQRTVTSAPMSDYVASPYSINKTASPESITSQPYSDPTGALRGTLSQLSPVQAELVQAMVPENEALQLIQGYGQNGNTGVPVSTTLLAMAQTRNTGRNLNNSSSVNSTPEADAQKKTYNENVARANIASNIMKNYTTANTTQMLEQFGRSEGYISKTYAGDFAKEALWETLTPDEKKLLTGKENPAVSNLDVASLPENYKELYDQINNTVTGLQEATDIKVKELGAEIVQATGITDKTTPAGAKIKAAAVARKMVAAVTSPSVVAGTARYISENPGDFQSILNYAADLKEKDREGYYSVLRGRLADDLRTAEMDEKKANTRIIKQNARKLEAMYGNDEDLKTLTDLEKAQQMYQTQLAYLQLSLAQASQQGDGGAELLGKMITMGTAVGNSEGMSKEVKGVFSDITGMAGKQLASLIPDLMLQISAENPAFFAGMRDIKFDTSVTSAAPATTTYPDDVRAFMDSKGIKY